MITTYFTANTKHDSVLNIIVKSVVLFSKKYINRLRITKRTQNEVLQLYYAL